MDMYVIEKNKDKSQIKDGTRTAQNPLGTLADNSMSSRIIYEVAVKKLLMNEEV